MFPELLWYMKWDIIYYYQDVNLNLVVIEFSAHKKCLHVQATFMMSFGSFDIAGKLFNNIL